MDLLAAFVTDDRVGYCEQFAAAMAAMGRALGHPLAGRRRLPATARRSPTAGSSTPATSGTPGRRCTSPASGWVRFEPTPAQRAGSVPGVHPAGRTRHRRRRTAPSTAATPRPVTGAGRSRRRDAAEERTSGSSVPWWPVVDGAGAGAARGRRRRCVRASSAGAGSRGTDPVHLAEGAWAELRATALDLGLDWPEQRSPREQAAAWSARSRREARGGRSLEGLLVQVERGRYARPAVGRRSRGRARGRSRTVETVDSWRTSDAGAHRRDRASDWRRSMVAAWHRERGWRRTAVAGRRWCVAGG